MADDWRTPPQIWRPLNAEFDFDLDAAATAFNTLCPTFLFEALGAEPWPGQRIFCNPPYGRMLGRFVTRCGEEAARGKLVVALIPVRTRAAWWHEAVPGRADEVRFIRKRPRFLRADGSVPKYTMSVDSCLVIWRAPTALLHTRMISWQMA